MSTAKDVRWVKDSTTFVIKEADLTEKKNGEDFKTPKRDIAHSDGLNWCIRWYPAGDKKKAENHISLYLWANKAVSAKYSFTVENSSIQCSSTYDFSSARGHGPSKFATHEALRPLFVDGQISVLCTVEFKIVSFTIRAPCLYDYGGHIRTDFVFIVGSDRINTYKHLLLLLSPELHAIVSKTAETVIDNFDSDTVKAAIAYCSGKKLKHLSVKTIIGILRFGDHYKISAITQSLGGKLESSVSIDTFCAITTYADESKNQKLFAKCCQFFKKNIKVIRTKDSFTKLTPKCATHLLKTAFDLETDAETFDYALFYALKFIVDYLEPLVAESLSLSDFCPMVKSAINYKRETLKKACGKFYTDHRDILRHLDPFNSLSLKDNILITKEWTTDLPVPLIMHLLKNTLKMKSEFDVLDYAYNNGFDFDWDELERPLLQSVTLDNFCAAAGYACSCSRDGLKQVCAKFYSANLVEIGKLKSFIELPLETIHVLLKLNYELVNNGMEIEG